MVFMPHWPKILGKKTIRLGLDRVMALLDRLGNPQDRLPPVIHVAGTNGKGSTIAFLRACLEAAGYRVHVYTSPHILEFNERIVLAGDSIGDDDLFTLMDECRIQAEGIEITFFEGTTVAALLAFSRVDADVVLLETGMGGRLDATNVVSQPLATVITPISMDHMEFLGNDVRLIAAEKAGIIKPNVSCIVSMQTDPAMDVLAHVAELQHAPMSAFEYEWGIELLDGGGFVYNSKSQSITLPKPSLTGEHQYLNAATAVATLSHLPTLDISEDALAYGITHTEWLGRLQHIRTSQWYRHLPEGSEIWVDGAHNDAGAQALAREVEKWTDMPLYLVCGFTRGRDPKPMLRYFTQTTKHLYGVLVHTEPSAQTGEVIADAASSLGFEAKPMDAVGDVFDDLQLQSLDGPVRVLLFGSLYLISDVL